MRRKKNGTFWEGGPEARFFGLLFEEEGFCLACGERGRALSGGLCPSCRAAIDRTSTCRKLTEEADFTVFSASFYNHFLRDQFADYKFSGKSYKEEIFVSILDDYMKNHPVLSRAGWLTYLPMRKRRETLRAYNPALNFARGLAMRRGLVLVHALRKVRESKEQHTLSRRDRMDNVRGSYILAEEDGFLSAEFYQGKEIVTGKVRVQDLVDQEGILVDDLVTTGRTMVEGAGPLLERGIPIYGLSLASASYPNNDQKEN